MEHVGYLKVLEDSTAVLLRKGDVLDGLKVERVDPAIIENRAVKTKISLEDESEIWLEHKSKTERTQMEEKTTYPLLTQETLEKAIKYDVLVNALFASADLSWDKTKLITANIGEVLLMGLEPVKYEKKLTELLEREQTKNGSQDEK